MDQHKIISSRRIRRTNRKYRLIIGQIYRVQSECVNLRSLKVLYV